MNPFGDDDLFGALGGSDSTLVNALYMYAVAKTLANVNFQLEQVQKILQQRPDTLAVQNSFDLSAAITEWLEKSDNVMRSEARSALEKDPGLADDLRKYGVNPDDLI